MKILAVTFCMAALFAFSFQNQAGVVLTTCETEEPYKDPDGPGPEVAECDNLGFNVCCTIGSQTFLRQ